MISDPGKNKNLSVQAQALYAAHLEQEKNAPLVAQLYSEFNSNNRQTLFQSLAEPNDTLFMLVKTVLEQRHILALSEGKDSVLESAVQRNVDPIHWKNLFRSPQTLKTRTDFAKHYSQNRKDALHLKNFYPWDFWLQSPAEVAVDPQRIALTTAPQKLIANFLECLGLADLTTRFTWISNNNTTAARLDFDSAGAFKPSLYIAESQNPTLADAALMAHEVGRIVQALLRVQPTPDTLAIPSPLSEIVPLLFQKLFLSPAVLATLTGRDAANIKPIMDFLQHEHQESLARSLCTLEFEIQMYEWIATSEFTPSMVASGWRHLKQQYYGFESAVELDASWQGNVFYVLYAPFYRRNFVLAEVLTNLLCHDLTGPAQLSRRMPMLLQQISAKGSKTTWRDVQKAWPQVPTHLPDFLAAVTKILDK